jgi:hypothetical protein
MVRVFLKGGVWKNSEDEILKAAVQKYGKQVSPCMPPVLPVEWKAAVAYPSQSVSYAIAHLKLLFFSFPFLIYDLLSTYLSIY